MTDELAADARATEVAARRALALAYFGEMPRDVPDTVAAWLSSGRPQPINSDEDEHARRLFRLAEFVRRTR